MVQELHDKITELGLLVQKTDCQTEDDCIITAILQTVEPECRVAFCTAFAMVCYIETKSHNINLNQLATPARALFAHMMEIVTADIMAENNEWPDPNKELSYNDDSSN